jgi:Glycosyl transferase family 2
VADSIQQSVLASISDPVERLSRPPAPGMNVQRRRTASAEASDKELTIVMPCLNEASSLKMCIEKAQTYLARSGVDGEVVVADNGSTDGSQEIARAAGARVIEVLERGYGAALYAGIAAARGRYVIMGDSDSTYDFSRLDAFVAKLREGNDLVMGNRFRGGIAPGAMPPLHRYLGNPALTRIARTFFGGNFGDIYCGLRGFKKTAIEELDLRNSGMEFACEMVVKATLQGLRVVEVPTTLSPDHRDRKPHLRTWTDGWRTLRFLLLYAPRWLFLYPGLLLVGIGVAAMAAVLPGPLEIGSVVFDLHTLVVAMGAILVGSQTVLFFMLAQRFAVNERLLPPSQSFQALRRFISLDRAVLAGGVLAVAGFVGLITAVVLWGRTSFADLDYGWMMRLVIPAVTLLAFGIQATLGAFLASLLDLRLR